MDQLQRILLASLICISAISWLVSRVFQVEMMSATSTPYDPVAVSLFVAVWTAGMAAMMFPAISPVVLLYSRLVRTGNSGATMVVEEQKNGLHSPKIILFVGSYLAVWVVTGLVLLLAWSFVVNEAIANQQGTLAILYGSILIAAGSYQFSPLKSKCLGYCESPMSLFMRRWRKGVSGALTMGTYHGLYCLGCCWPYFMIMVALGWMDILWMALFAGIIFGEKLWSKGIWVARAAGVGLAIAGMLIIAGLIASPEVSDSMMNMQMSGAENNQENQPAARSMSDSQGELSEGMPSMDQAMNEETNPGMSQ